MHLAWRAGRKISGFLGAAPAVPREGPWPQGRPVPQPRRRRVGHPVIPAWTPRRPAPSVAPSRLLTSSGTWASTLLERPNCLALRTATMSGCRDGGRSGSFVSSTRRDQGSALQFSRLAIRRRGLAPG